MNYWKTDDSDFRDVYYDFYLKARWSKMNKDENRIPYFRKLQSISPNDNLLDILDSLKEEMASKSFELSLGSKLLHTRNSNSPIYDSKVRIYLAQNGVQFWWHQSGFPRGTTERDKIKHDWDELQTWYSNFLTSSECHDWISWFNKQFPAYRWVSGVKKIDFIIFATN